MATVLDIATAAATELGVLAAGETMTAADAQLALDAVNRMVDQFAAERLQIYTVTRTLWTLVSGTQDYTVGTGGTLNIARPIYIDRLTFQDTAITPRVEIPLDSMTDAEWENDKYKTLQATYPRRWYYNPTFPLGTLSLWPVPTMSTLQGVIYVPAAVAEFAALSTSVSLPPGYRRMLVKNLALEMAPSFGRPVDPELRLQASDSKAVVKRANTRLIEMSFDAGALVQARPTFNIRTGQS